MMRGNDCSKDSPAAAVRRGPRRVRWEVTLWRLSSSTSMSPPPCTNNGDGKRENLNLPFFTRHEARRHTVAAMWQQARLWRLQDLHGAVDWLLPHVIRTSRSHAFCV